MSLMNRLHLVSWLKMSGDIQSLPHMTSWGVQDKPYFSVTL